MKQFIRIKEIEIEAIQIGNLTLNRLAEIGLEKNYSTSITYEMTDKFSISIDKIDMVVHATSWLVFEDEKDVSIVTDGVFNSLYKEV